MGQGGSTKNERKVNDRRAEEEKAREAAARKELGELRSKPVNVRTPEDDVREKKLQAIIKRSRLKRKSSENHTQRGKRGRR